MIIFNDLVLTHKVDTEDSEKKRTDLQAVTLAGPLWQKPVPDPLAVQLLRNRHKM